MLKSAFRFVKFLTSKILLMAFEDSSVMLNKTQEVI